jgi:hypothetical protein
MNGVYFNQWNDIISKYIDHPLFHVALDLFNVVNNKVSIFDVTNKYELPLLRKDIETSLELYIDSKQTNKYDQYWYSVPHMCHLSSRILASTLILLHTKKPVYVITMVPDDNTTKYHVVIVDRHVPKYTYINLNTSRQYKETIIMYDLIFALKPRPYNSWHNPTESLNGMIVTSCYELYNFLDLTKFII